MFYNFKIIMLDTWDFWCGLFNLLPYGDPYIATFALVMLFAMAIKMIVGGETA